ncbi:dihydropteroate synthase [Rhizosphaericola mali]|uniref:dihydropteroate synthase n=1 Tax=Rhizosphaericola mali TaxID=2545455 RepID=A0A5P2G364_9BACT|nr:dihydropteroate synthase [Rhizosphaericola mali]QES90264.1 dihydropteroate synthase [Rhizosphaericola mali]
MFTLNCQGKLLSLETPQVMGIINITPDSFFRGNRKPDLSEAIAMAENMLENGATILDIGGQSTRPGSTLLTAAEEAERLIPAVMAIKKAIPDAIISVDTFYANVAQASVDAGASIINDISGGDLDKEMIATVGKLNVPYVCMHMRGTPQTMSKLTDYENVTLEVLDFFIKKIEICREAGINNFIVDPGLGFAKTRTQNFTLLKNIEQFSILEKPILIGLSRKGMIQKTIDVSAEDALNGTTVLNTIALQNGANIIRVHDVKEAVQAVELVEYYKKAEKLKAKR